MSLDTLYTAETPEGIALSLRPAGVVPRFYAYLLDFLIRFGLFIALTIAASALGGMGTGLTLLTFSCWSGSTRWCSSCCPRSSLSTICKRP